MISRVIKRHVARSQSCTCLSSQIWKAEERKSDSHANEYFLRSSMAPKLSSKNLAWESDESKTERKNLLIIHVYYNFCTKRSNSIEKEGVERW